MAEASVPLVIADSSVACCGLDLVTDSAQGLVAPCGRPNNLPSPLPSFGSALEQHICEPGLQVGARVTIFQNVATKSQSFNDS